MALTPRPCFLFKNPVHEERIDDEDDAHEHLPQTHGDVLVVVRMAVVRGERGIRLGPTRGLTGGDLHTTYSGFDVSFFGISGSLLNCNRNSHGLPSARSGRKILYRDW